MKTKKAPPKATTKKTTAKAQPLPVVKFTRSTLAGMGFLCLTHGETECNCSVKELQRIGKLLHSRGLTEDAQDWYVLTPVVRFSCGGRVHEINVTAYSPEERVYSVNFIQGMNELETWMEKRPSESHPERTSEVCFPVSRSEAAFFMQEGKRQGFDNFEDFINHVLGEHFREMRFARKLGAAVGDRVAEKLSKKGALAK